MNSIADPKIQSNMGIAYIVNIILAAVLVGGLFLLLYTMPKYIAGFDFIGLILNSTGMSGIMLAPVGGVAVLLIAALRVNKLTAESAEFSGEGITFIRGGTIKITKTAPASAIRNIVSKPMMPFTFGDLTLSIAGEQDIIVRYVPEVKKLCDQLNGIETAGGGSVALQTAPGPKDTSSFRKEVIGYIEDELDQGYGLDQIEKELLDEGYSEDIINEAADYVEKHHKVSEKDKTKQTPRTDEEHHKRRFVMPMAVLAVLILLVGGIYYIAGFAILEAESTESLTASHIMLIDELGVNADTKIAASDIAWSKDELVQERLAQSTLRQHQANALLSVLEYSDAVVGVKKTATVHSIVEGGLKKKTLVEIRFQSEKDLDTLKIVESISKKTSEGDDIVLTKGGVLAVKDPVIIFTFRDVIPGEPLKAVYVIDKEIDELDSITFGAVEKPRTQRAQEPLICGDGRCVVGESHITCCTDCGCLPGFVCMNSRCGAAEIDQCRTDADCDDNYEGTQDKCGGSPKTCSSTPITNCIMGDNFCPDNCEWVDDPDCVPPPHEQDTFEPIPEIPQDEQASPNINDFRVSPETVGIGNEITVSAHVTDANGDLESVWFEVLELANTKGEKEDMNDEGQDGDRNAGDDTYTATRKIAEYYLQGWYHLTIYAKDSQGNQKKRQVMFQVSGEGVSVPADVQDCGSDMDCFATAADTCADAEVLHTATLDDGGMLITTTYNMEITGSMTDCQLDFVVESIDVDFSTELVQEKKDTGMTQEMIDQELDDINMQADFYERQEGNCVFESSALTGLLGRWKDAEIDLAEWDAGDCSGDYFEEF